MRTAMPREFYIPKRALKVKPKAADVVFYLYDNSRGKPACMCFIGRAQKPSWCYWYASPAAREAKIKAQIAAVIEHERVKAERRARANAGHNWEPGLILVASWGYEQTNVDFYEVVRVIGKTMVEIEAIGSQPATDDSNGMSSMAGYVVPDPEKRSGKLSRHKVSNDRISLSSFHGASVWDGRRRYCSWYA